MKILELLNLETGSSIENIRRIISNAPARYKVYEIPKRNGGTRTIAHPARELKILQRIVLKEILSKIPINPVATAYVSGRGILTNAQAHAGQRWVLKLDFKNFFHSITPTDWDRTVRRTDYLSQYASDKYLFHQLLFWGCSSKIPVCLSIGAPTSPAVSNLVCSKLDEWLVEHANKRGLKVTRYADDISVSGPNVRQLESFKGSLSRMLESNKGLRLILNEEKTGLYGPGERRMITGLVLTPEGKVSLGRERKREISTLVHKFTVGLADHDMVNRTKGLLGFANSVEPEYFSMLINKYGEKIINTILTAETPFDPLDLGLDL